MDKKSNEKRSGHQQVSEEKKMSYEELERVAHQLWNENRELQTGLQEAQRIIKGLDMVGILMSVIEKSEYFDNAFIDRCVSKLQNTVEDVFLKEASVNDTGEK